MLAFLDDREPAAHRYLITREGRGPRRAVRHHGVGGNPVLTERTHPSADRRRPAGVNVFVPVAGYEVDGCRDVAARKRVAN
jgi:hypothetical protein